MEEKQRNKVGYYSVIPSKILYNKELKANEKLLYAMDRLSIKIWKIII